MKEFNISNRDSSAIYGAVERIITPQKCMCSNRRNL